MPRNSKEIAIVIRQEVTDEAVRDVRPKVASNVSREPDAARLGAGSSTMGAGRDRGRVSGWSLRVIIDSARTQVDC
jgi:hypothetical protein